MTKFNILNPTVRLDSNDRVRKALEGAQAAAFLTAGVHALGGGMFLGAGKAAGLWLPHLGLALLAALVGGLVRARPSVWLASLIFGWALVEIPLTRPTMFAFRVVVILLAYQGLRGALARRKTIAAADVF